MSAILPSLITPPSIAASSHSQMTEFAKRESRRALVPLSERGERVNGAAGVPHSIKGDNAAKDALMLLKSAASEGGFRGRVRRIVLSLPSLPNLLLRAQEFITMYEHMAYLEAPLSKGEEVGRSFATLLSFIGKASKTEKNLVRYHRAVYGLGASATRAHLMRTNPEVFTLDMMLACLRVKDVTNTARLLRIFEDNLQDGNECGAWYTLTRLLELETGSKEIFQSMRRSWPVWSHDLRQLNILEEWHQQSPSSHQVFYFAVMQILPPAKPDIVAGFKRVAQRLRLIQPFSVEEYPAELVSIPPKPTKRAKLGDC